MDSLPPRPSLNSRAVRLLACAAGGWLLLTTTAHARTLRYPNLQGASSLLSFKLPDGWETHRLTSEVDGLECTSDQGIGLVVSFMAIPAAAVTKDFTGTILAIMQQDKLNRKAKLVAMGDDTIGDGLKVKFARFANKVDGDPLHFTLYCLPTRGDKAVIIEVIDFPDEPASSRGIIRKLLASIRLI